METEPTCRRFSIDEIQSATQNFDDSLVVGRGGFGKVYKGRINNGSTPVVAIKRLHSMSDQGAPEFQAEIEMLSKLRHCNLVSLIGYCNEGSEMVLVYEYMPHGTLEDRLQKDEVPLSWLQRLKICIGAARGLDYLHTGTGTQHGVIHRDVKTSNVLLDENFAAKISDFGLAKIGPTNQTRTYVSTGVKGTFGYMDPGYFFSGKLTRKSDVYSFGVVLLEVLCGRPAVDTSLDEEQWGLVPWAQDRIKEGKVSQIVDSRLRGHISSNCVKDFARIACRCLHNRPTERPTMAEIIARLEHMLKLDSSVTEGKFVHKVRLFFSAKVKPKSSQIARRSEGEPSGTTEVDSSSKDAPQLTHFDSTSWYTYEDLRLADAELISEGSYWNTYLSTMENGSQLVVRRLVKGLFWRKAILKKFHALKLCHPHILAPNAYCDSKDVSLFISDYIKNGSVASLLYPSEGQGRKPLFWITRMRIIVGITRGLVYLHTQKNMAHGRLTSRNVLIGENYNPLIADAGISLLIDDARPNSPLIFPSDFLKFNNAKKKMDVYSLGLIMLEFLTRKSMDLETHGISLPSWVMSIPREALRAKVFDPDLKRENPKIKQDLVHILELAMACVSLKPDARPEAQEVLRQLEKIYWHIYPRKSGM